MRLRAPTTPSCCGVEPAFHLDMLSADELAGQGVSLLPAATPPSVNNGLVLNGTTQYAVARKSFAIGTLFSFYYEFMPNFAANDGNYYVMSDGDNTVGSNRIGFHKTAAGTSNRLYLVVGGSIAVIALADYQALWRSGQRNKIVALCQSSNNAVYLNGSLLPWTSDAAWVLNNSDLFYIGAASNGTFPLNGNFYDVRIYSRKLTSAEAIELTTLT